MSQPDTGPDGAPQAVRPPACDMDAFIERVGGDHELACEMAMLFIPDALRLLEQLEAAVAAGDAERVRQEAHALKGSAGNFDAAPTVAGALALEMMGKAGDLTRAGEVLATLQVDAVELIDALRLFGATPPCGS